jgi:predicted nucleic acid-binding protein
VTVVVDASMTMAWLFGEERTDATDAAFQRVVDDETFVPSLWHLEVANSLWSAIRRGRCDETYALQSLGRLRRLNFLTDGETETHAWGRTRELAARHQLSVYDAAYLELAMRRQGTLATLDAALAKAARGVGLDVISN